ncbi:nucleotide-binding universal stress UspA family protein [Pontibacter ummariensis]|uniref:Nucleotide-binding universal stress protein, UspA family n=1 Tax=Pontibacter ummariensis TaxID=1610492 RepID=A0A239JY92_9BACT|nr:universal stress protein [Pontibacter ummariensis]PRY07272.1 nucleotide-binding universal stress UspA family protein [Pontibacter ummariensis]SNT10735.1 Nucleotide-binding universal stress protein, UspA family [Pontibacter ummariensis]
MKTLLVPTDFSDNATNAIRYAVALANITSCRLVLVHVMAIQVMTTAESTAYTSYDPRVQRYHTDKLKAIAHQLQLENAFKFEVGYVCQYGSFHDVLNELASNMQADLVVMGARGTTNFLDRAFGTTAATYIKEAVCPVLAVPAAASLSELKTIAFAADFSDKNDIFLQQLFQLAESLGAKVCLVQIITKPQVPTVAGNLVPQDIASRFTDRNFSVAQEKAHSVAAGIKHFVSENKIDILALAIHEKSFLQDLFHRSISKRLALGAHFPLLGLPEKPYWLQDLQQHESEAVTG